MVENVQMPQFSEVRFTTSTGENCAAIKENGIVTIKGDKNGIRQMPLNDFMKFMISEEIKKKGFLYSKNGIRLKTFFSSLFDKIRIK